jgi:hypothetical protein
LQQVLHWQLFIEEYGPKFCHCHEIDNIEADKLSCYPCLKGENMNEQLFYEDLLLKSFLIIFKTILIIALSTFPASQPHKQLTLQYKTMPLCKVLPM